MRQILHVVTLTPFFTRLLQKIGRKIIRAGLLFAKKGEIIKAGSL